METCTRKYWSSKKQINWLTKRIFGGRLLKLPELLKSYMRRKSFIGIWKAQTSSSTEMAPPNLVTSMSQRSPRRGCSIHRRELHTMRRQKSGEINLTIANQISGLLDASSMRWLLWSLRLGLKTWTAFTNEYWKVLTQRSPRSIPEISRTWSCDSWALNRS